MTDRPYQLLPPLDEEQRHLLRQSIEKNGVLEPVVFDEDGEILDGHHRVEIAEELDIDYPRRVVADLDETGKRRYAITTNLARRHLVPSVRSGLVAQLRMQGLSIREIAKEIGASVGKVHKDLQVFTNEHLPPTVTGADGKTYASTRPAPTPGPSDAAVTPPVDPGATPAPVDESPVLVVPQEPAPAEAVTPTREGGGVTASSVTPPPGSPATWTAEQHEANRREVQARQIRESGIRHAKTVTSTLAAEIGCIVDAFDLGERDLITEELIAELHAAVDLLATRIEVHE